MKCLPLWLLLLLLSLFLSPATFALGSESAQVQVLAKLAARRIDLAVLMQEEAQPLLASPEFAGLALLPKPMQTLPYYAVRGPAPSVQQRALAQRWWTEIARLRELPAYRP